jgi:hypothetical protein
MGSTTAARALLAVGFLAAWIGYDAWILSHVVLNPDATRSAAHALLETPAVRNGLADQLAAQVDRRLPSAAKDPRVEPAVTAALRDPRVVTAFTDTIVEIHEALLSGTDQKSFTVDGRALSAALHDVLVTNAPGLAAQIKRAPPLTVSIRSKDLPQLNDPRSATSGLAVLAILATLLLITASLLLRHDRRAFALVGRRIAYLAITPLSLFLVLPSALGHVSGTAPEVARTLLRTYGDRILPSAIGLVLVGVFIVLGARLWPRNRFDDQPGPPPYQGTFPPSQPEITDRLYL